VDKANPAPERWLPVPGYEGLYEVSNRGRVKSIPRRGGRNRMYGGGLLRPTAEAKSGYLIVGLWSSNENETLRVHALVVAAFVGPRPEGQEVRHLDGNPANNRWEPGDETETQAAGGNLIYGTRSENGRDTVRHGRNWAAGKMHCPQGHPYNEANTHVNVNGGRECRRCLRLATWKRRGKEPDSPTKRPALKTHCKRGHEFTPENTYIRPDGGGRQCCACNRIRAGRAA